MFNEEEDYSKIKLLIDDMVNTLPWTENIDSFIDFLDISVDGIYDIETSSQYSKITELALQLYNKIKIDAHPLQLKLANAINTWLNHKLEMQDCPEKSVECRISLLLFTDIISNINLVSNDSSLTNDYQEFSALSLMIGLEDRNYELVEQAIIAQRKVLELYTNGKFPDYYNIHTFILGARTSLASTLMEAYKFDRLRYSKYYKEIGVILENVVKERESCGTDSDREYSLGLFEEYVNCME